MFCFNSVSLPIGMNDLFVSRELCIFLYPMVDLYVIRNAGSLVSGSYSHLSFDKIYYCHDVYMYIKGI